MAATRGVDGGQGTVGVATTSASSKRRVSRRARSALVGSVVTHDETGVSLERLARRGVSSRLEPPEARALLADVIETCRNEILDGAVYLAALCGPLPQVRRWATEDPEGYRAANTGKLDSVLRYLRAAAADERRGAWDEMIALQVEVGRRLAERSGARAPTNFTPHDDPAPGSHVVIRSVLMQAILDVLLNRYASRWATEQLLECVLTLDEIAFDMTIVGILGYVTYEEDLLDQQQATVLRLLDELAHAGRDEQRAMARALEDRLTRSLVAVLSGVQHAQRRADEGQPATRVELARLAGITQQAIQDVQHAIHSMLGRSRTEVAGVVRQGGLRADADETGERGRDGVIALPNALSYAQESSIIAIIQEALSNARRHAAPGVIDVAVDVSGPELTIVVRDDGRGFNVAEALAGGRRSGRSGLRRMQERARLLGATLDIASHPGGGTSVLLRMRCDQVHGSPVTVLVVDDHQLGRAGLVRLLADYVMLTVVGEAGTVAEAAAQAEALNPDVIVMTTDLLGDDGRAAVRAITQRRPDTRLVLLTGHGRDDVVFDALCAGASGVLPRDIALDELARTIHAVAQGGAVLSSRLARRLLDVLQRGDGPAEPRRKPAPDELSAREREVLARIAAGQTCRAIATALGLSENTVKRHTSNLYQKLHVHHRSQATAEAIRRGLIPADAADAVAASS